MTSTVPTQKPYKKLLLEARRLRTATGTNSYRLAVILVRVFADAEFRADNRNADDLRLARILDDYCQPLTLTFLELKAVLAKFPKEADWKDGKLRRMYDATVEDTKASRRKPTPVVEENGTVHVATPRRSDPVATVSKSQPVERPAVREQVCRECIRKQAIIDQLRAKLAELEGIFEPASVG